MCLTPILIKNPNRHFQTDFLYIYVPCGKCAECISTKMSDWVIRLKEELKDKPYSFFITLTYDEASIPLNEVTNLPCPKKRDIQNFMRFIRRKGYSIKYFFASEYGPQTRRPHYHGILFFDTYVNDIYKLITKCWTKGFVYIGNANAKTISYVVKYILKDYAGHTDNFYLMSKGIGKGYINRMWLWHRDKLEDRQYFPDGTFKKHLPRYYREKIYTNDEQIFINIRKSTLLPPEPICSNSQEFWNEEQRKIAKQEHFNYKLKHKKFKQYV